MEAAHLVVQALVHAEDGAASNAHVDAAADLLQRQWPRHSAGSWAAAIQATVRTPTLPLHFIGLLAGERGAPARLVAHGSLHASAFHGDGRNAVLQSLVVDSATRRTGIGRRFLDALESEAAARGFGYMLLCTKDQQPFYLACGYRTCEPVNLDVPVLTTRSPEAVTGLEALLRRRTEGSDAGSGHATGTAAHTAGPVQPKELVTWFEKRLRAFPGPAEVLRLSWDARVHSSSQEFDAAAACSGQLRQLLQHPHGRRTSESARTDALGSDVLPPQSCCLVGQVQELLWLRQIGPSCGLTAVLMIADTAAARRRARGGPASTDRLAPRVMRLAWSAADGLSRAEAPPPADAMDVPSPASPTALRSCLLPAAVAAGLTADGEVFDIAGLCSLVGSEAGLPTALLGAGCEGAALAGDGPLSAATIVQALENGSVLLIAYDGDSSRAWSPCSAGGAKAHWAVVCGYLRCAASDSAGTCGCKAKPETAPIKVQSCDGASGNVTSVPVAGAGACVAAGPESAEACGSTVYLILAHSMSAIPVVCDAAALLASNAQLHRADERKARAGGWLVGRGKSPHLAGAIAVSLR